jgi:hypothetical protein
MGYEGFPVQPPEAIDAPVFDESYFLDTFGLGPRETSTVVTFGNHTGTVAAMLADGSCPVGGIVAEAYKAEGLAGVEQKLTSLGALSADFSVPISEATRSYHAGTIQRDELLAERPDFLA